ncbi:actin depolymerizing protein [Ascobolus immersus RN42]|uniref:Twinfilin n=1 Tax=Ascobolus immersus RN42 TaxID=1160509 RepID=A0A3N4HYY8_ASCIM|nr:actin depolymerizing protein [Ascobolus immersus RN42]
MQSGITASQELLDTFKAFTEDTSKRGFLVTVEKESLVPKESFPASSSFDDDLKGLESLLTTDVAVYIILRKDPPPAPLISIAYVPDAANVRQKMLIASTRNTLIKQLGGEKFGDSIFTTEKHELTAEGFKKHEAHTKLENPLTEEERVLKEVRDAEYQAQAGTTNRKAHVSSGVGFPISADAVDALNQLKEGEVSLVQLFIDVEQETIHLASASSTDVSGLADAISKEEPRYSVFRYTHEHNGSEESPAVFLYTCPTASKVKVRMIYATSRGHVAQTIEKEFGVKLAKTLEADDASEIDAKHLNDLLHPQKEESKTFSRPKRPGRR